MFICSVKASSVKFFTVLGLATALLIVMIFTLPTTTDTTSDAIAISETSISYNKVKTEQARTDFLKQFGWETEPSATEEVEVQIPTDFDKIMNSYNNIQRNQGLDLSKYKGKRVNRYTYKVTNYPDYDGTVYANIIVYKNKVIGGDICSSDIEGFIHGFENPNIENINN